MSADANNRYGPAKLKRGLLSFLGGKGASAVSGLLTLLLLVRWLSPTEFAAYSAMVGMVEVVMALSGMGINHALLRFVPDLHSRHFDVSLEYMVKRLLVLRILFSLLFVFVCALFSEKISDYLGIKIFINELRLFFVLLFARILVQTLFQVLEALLLQGWAQIIFIATAIGKLIGVLILHEVSALTLLQVLQLECTIEVMGVVAFGVILWLQLARYLRESPADSGETPQAWLKNNHERVSRFCLMAYFQHVAIVFYGSSPNRLVGAHLLSVTAMASLGVAQSFADIFRRYLPAQLLIGLIRPALIAQFAKDSDFALVGARLRMLLRLNNSLIALPIALLWVGGGDLLNWISGGNYGDGAAKLLVIFLLVLMLESQRLMLDLATQLVEKVGVLVPANIILSLSTFVAVPFVQYFGVSSIPAANFFGLVVANEWVRRSLATDGVVLPGFWRVVIGAIFTVCLPAAVGQLVLLAGMNTTLACAAVVVTYAGLIIGTGALTRRDIGELLTMRSSARA